MKVIRNIFKILSTGPGIKNLYVILPVSLFFLLLNSSLYSQAIDLDPEVVTGTLPNGFTYFLRKNHLPADKIEMHLVVKAGSFHEDNDQLEFAHFLEHMAFNGTKKFPGNEITDYFTNIGLRPGTDWNAHTSEYTNYFFRIPAGSSEVFDKSLQILYEWAQNLTLDPKEIDEERGVLLGEYRIANSASTWIQQATTARLFEHPKYRTDQIFRMQESIKTFRHESLARFYANWYRPDLEALIIVGNINLDETEDKIKKLFGDLKMPNNPRKVEDFAARYSVPVKRKGQFVTLTDSNLTNVTVTIYQKRKASLRTIKTQQDIRKLLIDKLYNHMIMQRIELINQLKEKSFDRAFNSVERNAFNGLPQIDILSTYIELGKGQSERKAISSVFSEINRVASQGFVQDELEYAIIQTRQEEEIFRDEHFNSSNIAGKLEKFFFDSSAVPSPSAEVELRSKILSSITLQEINLFAKEWINDYSSMDIVVLMPLIEETETITKRCVLQWIVNSRKTKIAPHHLPLAITTLIKPPQMAEMDKRDVVEEEKPLDDLEIKEVKLKNGIKIFLKQQESTDKKIILSAFRPGGMSYYNDSDAVNIANIGILIKNGVADFDKVQIENFLSSHNMRIAMWMDSYNTRISGSCKTSDVEKMFQLIRLQMIAPRMDRSTFEILVNSLEKQAMSGKSNFSYLDSMGMLLYNDVYLGDKALTAANVNKIRFDRICEIYRLEFMNPSGFTFIISGDFEESKVIDFFAKYLGTIPGKKLDREIPVIRPKGILNNVNHVFYTGNKPGAEVYLHFPGKYVNTFKTNLLLEVLRQVLGVRLRQRLREKESGTYSVVVNAIYGKEFADNYDLNLSFACDINNVQHMVKATLDEIMNLKNIGVDDNMLMQVKEQIRKQWHEDLATPDFWSNYITKSLIEGERPERLLSSLGMLEIISPATVNDAAKYLIQEKNMSHFIILPRNMQPGNAR